uniref:Nudix hydrolase domain-containing protein n=1 Tax=viral metagenome TaxID=1070528 RepID=A0A6C0KNU9_9ZZZZ
MERHHSSYRNNQPTICTNCGGHGHVFRQCIAPVTSYGVIMVRPQKGFDIANSLSNNPGLVTGMEGQNLEFLLIQRRDSLGFIELMRGRYKITDIDYIRLHLGAITDEERNKYREGPFEKLWSGMWGLDHSHLYKNEYEIAKGKWEQIHTGVTDLQGKFWTIEEIIASAPPAPATPEWGFPKGRRDAQESDYVCAMREMFEETGVKESQVIPIQNLEPLVESFFGSNHVHYCHKYYIVWVPAEIKVEFDDANDTMRREIGNLKWFSLSEALKHLREENIEKREVLLKAASMFRNLCPFPVRPKIGSKAT